MGFQMTGQFILLLATAGHLRVPTSASLITLTKDPPTIKPILTKQLSVRCDLNDTQTGSTLVGKRDGVVQTSTNIKHLVSLVVLRNGVDLATVTGYTPASGVGDQGTLNVTGDITGSTGYLELNWTYPGEEESGNLTCEANGIDATGHNTVYTTSIVVGVQEPSLSDLVNHVHRQEVLLVQQTGQLNQLTSKLDDQSSKLTQQASLISAQAKEISHLSNMTDHVEVGEVDCGDSYSWTQSPNYSITKPVTFKDRYGAPPLVLLSATFVDKWSATDYNVPVYELYALSVTEAGFTLRCKTQGSNSRFRWQNFKVTWASFPQYRP